MRVAATRAGTGLQMWFCETRAIRQTLRYQNSNPQEKFHARALRPEPNHAFQMQFEMFELLADGKIKPLPTLSLTLRQQTLETIKRLKLNSPACRRLRRYYMFKYHSKQITTDHLRERAPFVWLEMQRQGWL